MKSWGGIINPPDSLLASHCEKVICLMVFQKSESLRITGTSLDGPHTRTRPCTDTHKSSWMYCIRAASLVNPVAGESVRSGLACEALWPSMLFLWPCVRVAKDVVGLTEMLTRQIIQNPPTKKKSMLHVCLHAWVRVCVEERKRKKEASFNSRSPVQERRILD